MSYPAKNIDTVRLYALDTTTIDLSLKVFLWAHFRKVKAAVKMRAQIDLRVNILVYPRF